MSANNWNPAAEGPKGFIPAPSSIRAVNSGSATIKRYSHCVPDGYDTTRRCLKVKRTDTDAPLAVFLNLNNDAAQNAMLDIITPFSGFTFLVITDVASPTVGRLYGPKKNTDSFAENHGPFICISAVTGWPYMAVLMFAQRVGIGQLTSSPSGGTANMKMVYLSGGSPVTIGNDITVQVAN